MVTVFRTLTPPATIATTADIGEGLVIAPKTIGTLPRVVTIRPAPVTMPLLSGLQTVGVDDIVSTASDIGAQAGNTASGIANQAGSTVSGLVEQGQQTASELSGQVDQAMQYGQAYIDKGIGLVKEGEQYVNAATGKVAELANSVQEIAGKISGAITTLFNLGSELQKSVGQVIDALGRGIGLGEIMDQQKALDLAFGYTDPLGLPSQGHTGELPYVLALDAMQGGVTWDPAKYSSQYAATLDFFAKTMKQYPDKPWAAILSTAAQYDKNTARMLGATPDAPDAPKPETDAEYQARVKAENDAAIARYVEQRTYEAKAQAAWLQAQSNWNVAESQWLRERYSQANYLLTNVVLAPIRSSPAPRTAYSGAWWGGPQAVSPTEFDSFEGLMLQYKNAPTSDARKAWLAKTMAGDRANNTVALIEFFAAKRGIKPGEYAGWLVKFDMVDPARLPAGFFVEVKRKETGPVTAIKGDITEPTMQGSSEQPSGEYEPSVEEIETAVWGPQPDPVNGGTAMPEIDPAKVPSDIRGRVSPYLWGVWGSK